jgi:hypothetical protein
MSLELEFAGFDEVGRRAFLGYAQDLDEISELEPPSGGRFLLFLGADTSEASADALFSFACSMLDRGAVYVLAWGQGCERVEEIFDEAIVHRDLEGVEPVIMTTSHTEDSIMEALEFATTVAIPAKGYEAVTLLILFAGNVNWYNEAHICLEDLLRSEPPTASG